MYVTAIILAAGRGKRLRANISKPLIKINSKPAIVYCFNTLSKHPYIRDIIAVVNSENSEDIIDNIRRYRIDKIKDVISGGPRRQDSVRNGLKAMDRRTDFVLIHDGVRPFIDKETISTVIKEAKRAGAAITGVPIRATIKEVHSPQCPSVHSKLMVKRTLNRRNLWEVQTPQVFKKNLILKAYERFGDSEVTDDAMLIEKLGARVSIVLGSYNNIKITTPEDLAAAEAISKSLMTNDKIPNPK